MGHKQFSTTTIGTLPTGTDIATVLEDGDDRALFAVWATYHRSLFERGAATEHAEVSHLQALEAARRLTDNLEEWRWVAIQHALADGYSWPEIGAALAMPAETARETYERRSRHATEDEPQPGFHPYG